MQGSSGKAKSEKAAGNAVSEGYEGFFHLCDMKGDVEHAMAGAGECAQRITDLPKTKDMVEKVMGDAETIIRGLAAKYVAD